VRNPGHEREEFQNVKSATSTPNQVNMSGNFSNPIWTSSSADPIASCRRFVALRLRVFCMLL